MSEGSAAAGATAADPGGPQLLVAESVTMDFGGVRALHRCSIRVSEGEIYSIIGPNGAGKSTLFNIVSGVYRPTNGRVWFRGRRVDRLRASAIGRMGLARTFQNIELFGGMTVLENLLVGAHRHMGYGLATALLGGRAMGRAEAEGRRRLTELLRFLRIEEVAEERVEDLPYGTQKRIEMARALATRPRLLLLDDPAAGLNDAETQDLMNVLSRIRGEMAITLLLVEHNMRFVMGLSDRVSVLSFGEVLAQGTPEEIQADPRVVEAYLGESLC